MINRLFISVILLLIVSGCEPRTLKPSEAGAAAGGALGAGLGAIVGNQTGDAGTGLAVGATVGAASGGAIGYQLEQENEEIAARSERLAALDRQIEENKRLIAELKRRGADVRHTKRGVIVNLPDVLFKFARAELSENARRTVRDIAELIKDNKNRHVSIEGHTDSVGSIPYNLRLSSARAQAVHDELLAQGVPRAQMTIRSMGETDPIASNSTDYGRSRNRRVEVVIEN